MFLRLLASTVAAVHRAIEGGPLHLAEIAHARARQRSTERFAPRRLAEKCAAREQGTVRAERGDWIRSRQHVNVSTAGRQEPLTLRGNAHEPGAGFLHLTDETRGIAIFHA